MSAFADWTWLPYLFAVMLTVFVAWCFWEERETVRLWHAVGTAFAIVALLGSIGLTRGDESTVSTELAEAATLEQPDTATSTTLLTGTDVPTDVQGASETRSDYDRIVSCETALAQIAAAIRQTSPDDVVGSVPEDDAINGDGADATVRLQSCEVRLQAIAATLPR